jgi:hypothetical protein
MDEAHVEHAIAFVEHQHFDLGQIDGALADVIEQTARVATTMSTPCLSALICGLIDTPPKIMVR